MKYFLILSLFALQVFAQNTPEDEQFEDRIARINQKFNSSEISEDEWAQVVGDKSSESYSLTEGDTLWDISEKLFGNGFYWPKVWQLNDTITNPHNVKVGSALKFTSGTLQSAPQLNVEGADVGLNMADSGDDSTDTEEVSVQSESSPDEIVKSEIIIPRGKTAIEPLQTIPDSLPEWRDSDFNYNEEDITLNSKLSSKDYKLESYVSEVISDGPWKSSGRVLGMDDDEKSTAATYENIFIKLDENAETANETYTIFKNGNVIYDPQTKKEAGVQIIIKGFAKVKKAYGKEPNTFIAEVSKTVSPIQKGDSIVPGIYMVLADFEAQGATSPVNARIIDGDFTNRKLFKLHDTVFLNKGEKDGVQKGSLLEVVNKYGTKISGKIRIVNVAQNVSTGVIVKNKDAIRTGDETALGESQESSDTPSSETLPDVDLPSQTTEEEF